MTYLGPAADDRWLGDEVAPKLAPDSGVREDIKREKIRRRTA